MNKVEFCLKFIVLLVRGLLNDVIHFERER